jgi:hypothetical protein
MPPLPGRTAEPARVPFRSRPGRVLSPSLNADQQLAAIGRLHDLFEGQGIAYWLFGGCTVDFHAGRRTRSDADIDIAIWKTDLAEVDLLLGQEGWTRVPQPGEDGSTEYESGSLHLDLAFVARR